MAKILFSLLIALFSFSGVQNPALPEVPEKIIIALKSGNATELAKYFNSNIEIAILDNEDVYSSSQAEQILKKFFAKNKPSDFKVVHEGGKEGAKYVIGSLDTNTGTYRVYLLLKEKEGKVSIHTLRIENDEE